MTNNPVFTLASVGVSKDKALPNAKTLPTDALITLGDYAVMKLEPHYCGHFAWKLAKGGLLSFERATAMIVPGLRRIEASVAKYQESGEYKWDRFDPELLALILKMMRDGTTAIQSWIDNSDMSAIHAWQAEMAEHYETIFPSNIFRTFLQDSLMYTWVRVMRLIVHPSCESLGTVMRYIQIYLGDEPLDDRNDERDRQIAEIVALFPRLKQEA